MTHSDATRPLPELCWFKSSHSSGEGGECVEVAYASPSVHLRDSKDPNGPRLSVTAGVWSTFVHETAMRHRLGVSA